MIRGDKVRIKDCSYITEVKGAYLKRPDENTLQGREWTVVEIDIDLPSVASTVIGNIGVRNDTILQLGTRIIYATARLLKYKCPHCGGKCPTCGR